MRRPAPHCCSQCRKMVQRKTATLGGQGDKVSAVVQQFSAGFVPSSAQTDAEKMQAKEERAKSNLLAVDDDDSQVQIYRGGLGRAKPSPTRG
eukprot:1388199-Prymnesium_polylepis.1